MNFYKYQRSRSFTDLGPSVVHCPSLLVPCQHLSSGEHSGQWASCSYFPQKIGFDISCKLLPMETNLQETSEPVFWEK